jgi:hypothetical protein
MKNVAAVITGMEEVTTFQYGKKAQGDESEVTIVKLHAKMCQGMIGIEALAAGGGILACGRETKSGDRIRRTDGVARVAADQQ